MELLNYLRTGKAEPEERSINSGVMIPQTLLDKIWAVAGKYPLIDMITRFTVSKNKSRVPLVETDPALLWLEEGGSYPEEDAEFSGAVFNLHKLGVLAKVSEELLQDSAFDVETLLAEAFGRSLGEEMEKVFIEGDGTGKPTGFLMSCETVQGDLWEGAKEVYKALPTKYLHNARWLISQKAYSELCETQGDIVGNKSVIDDNTLFGLPVHITLMPDDKPIALGDFSQYMVLEKPPQIQRMNENYADSGLVGFVYRSFIDGKLLRTDSVVALELN